MILANNKLPQKSDSVEAVKVTISEKSANGRILQRVMTYIHQVKANGDPYFEEPAVNLLMTAQISALNKKKIFPASRKTELFSQTLSKISPASTPQAKPMNSNFPGFFQSINMPNA